MANKKQRKSSWGGVVCGIALFLACVLIVGLSLQAFGTGKQKPSEWFKKAEQTEKTEEKNSGAFIDDVKENRIRLTSKEVAYAETDSAQSSYKTSYEITATVLPEWADSRVSWNLTFNNPASEWANGKILSEYLQLEYWNDSEWVSVVPQSMSYNKCRVTVLQPFGEAATLTATSVSAPSKNASVAFQFMKRINEDSITLTLREYDEQLEDDDGNYTYTPVDGIVYYKKGSTDYSMIYNVKLDYSLGVGTVDPTVSISGYCNFKSKYEDDLIAKRYSGVTNAYNNKYGLDIWGGFKRTSISTAHYAMGVTEGSLPLDWFMAWVDAEEVGAKIIVEMTISVSGSDNLYRSEYKATAEYNMDVSYLRNVTNVSLSQTEAVYF